MANLYLVLIIGDNRHNKLDIPEKACIQVAFQEMEKAHDTQAPIT